MACVMTILIVDDHALFRAQARVLLEAEGISVIGEAEDRAGAVSATRRLQPDVVLLDIGLEEVDGLTLVDELMDRDGRPIVVLTSSRPVDSFGALVTASRAAGFVAKEDISGPAIRALVPS
jgi:DNA-binding NarL/FixJ family response regulator